jgi:colanic acid/amylovoran biosynthesis glycosyltransferase
MLTLHLLRKYLSKTETFIHMQLRLLNETRAVVLSREFDNLDRFPDIQLRCFSREVHTWGKSLSDFIYNRFKLMTPIERHYFINTAREINPDILHAHYAVDAAYFIFLKKYLKKPLIVSCYGYDVSNFANRYLGIAKHYLQFTWHDADIILAMSNDMRNDLIRLGCPPSKIIIHYYGIDLSRFKYVDRSPNRQPISILFVGSLAEKKGIDTLLRAFIRIERLRPEVHLRIVGTGGLRSCLEKQVNAAGLADRVSFAGFVDHKLLWKEFNAAHIFCHPSRTQQDGGKEGIPGTIVEAMSTGLPVVTTDHAGIPEMVIDKEHGFVVSEKDRDAIITPLLTLIDNPELCLRYGQQAAKRANAKADARLQTAKLESIYQDILRSTNSKITNKTKQ